MWFWRRVEKISWTDFVKNKKVAESRKKEMSCEQ
jgi:hypothetical protein